MFGLEITLISADVVIKREGVFVETMIKIGNRMIFASQQVDRERVDSVMLMMSWAGPMGSIDKTGGRYVG